MTRQMSKIVSGNGKKKLEAIGIKRKWRCIKAPLGPNDEHFSQICL